MPNARWGVRVRRAERAPTEIVRTETFSDEVVVEARKHCLHSRQLHADPSQMSRPAKIGPQTCTHCQKGVATVGGTRVTTIDEYQQRCEKLFVAGGNAAVRRTAQAGLDELGPGPDLYCWLALGHAAEDDDEHDDHAEEAFRAGLVLDGDHLGLLAGYAELCLRADAFEYPGRAARAVPLSKRLKQLAPQSAEADRLEAAEHWARSGYWDDLRMRAAAAAVVGRDTEAQARALAVDLRHGDEAATRGMDIEDRDAVVRAATLKALSAPWNAPARILGRHRTTAWVLSGILCLLTNTVLRQTGVIDTFSAWGFLWALPVPVVDRGSPLSADKLRRSTSPPSKQRSASGVERTDAFSAFRASSLGRCPTEVDAGQTCLLQVACAEAVRCTRMGRGPWAVRELGGPARAGPRRLSDDTGHQAHHGPGTNASSRRRSSAHGALQAVQRPYRR
ncbi:hypothetical protein M2163_009036 [Streptomyces sp. SAI-135]|uniref:hypothetical protein n=1 Tax=unclassified Streptomyces TaxID=2593676 RepID=UPI002475B5C6|nr:MULTISPECIES: hypothetical protein [unclassified Streptomyces]MDH6513992.1 hypothetical protein [Streptomyces sp. SAI-090]MDH6621928.1 hypothetical protein [Streptomyces sp. SAI-135]